MLVLKWSRVSEEDEEYSAGRSMLQQEYCQLGLMKQILADWDAIGLEKRDIPMKNGTIKQGSNSDQIVLKNSDFKKNSPWLAAEEL